MVVSFVLYLVVLVVIGLVSARRARSTDDFLPAGRRLGVVASSFSTEATSMSGWLLMGLPGQVFRLGLVASCLKKCMR